MIIRVLLIIFLVRLKKRNIENGHSWEWKSRIRIFDTFGVFSALDLIRKATGMLCCSRTDSPTGSATSRCTRRHNSRRTERKSSWWPSEASSTEFWRSCPWYHLRKTTSSAWIAMTAYLKWPTSCPHTKGQGFLCTSCRRNTNANTPPVNRAWQMVLLTLSLPTVINFKIPLQPHQKYEITQNGELGFS